MSDFARAPANPYVQATATFHPIALGQVTCPFAPEDQEKDVKSAHHSRPTKQRNPGGYKIQFEYIAHAYVWLERPDPLTGKLKTYYARTNQNGILFDSQQRDPAKMAKAPDIAGTKLLHKRQLVATTGSKFRVYWSVDPTMFKHFVAAVEEPGAKRAEVFARFGVHELRAAPYVSKRAQLELLDADQNRGLPTYLLTQGGLFREHPSLGFDFATFDVTPPTLRALYLTEFVRWAAVYAPEQSGKHLAALWRAMQVIELAKHGWADAWLDAELAKAGPEYLPKQGSPERAVLEAYRDFAWQCAHLEPGGGEKPVSFVDRESFTTSLETYARDLGQDYRQTRWYDAADKIGDETRGKAVHPVFRKELGGGVAKLSLDVPHREHLLRYYDLYSLGFSFQARADYQHDFLSRVSAAFDGFQRQVEICQELQGQVFQSAPFVKFMTELAQARDDDGSRRDLLTRYISAGWNIGSPWWKEFDQASPRAFWESVEPAIKVMTTGASVGAKFLEAFYSKPFAALVHSHEGANQAVNHHHTLGIMTRGGAILLDDLPDDITASLELDPERDAVRVLSDGVHTDVAAEPLRVKPKGTVRRWLTQLQALKDVRLSMSDGKVHIHDIPVPVSPARLKQLKQEMPAQLGLAANALNFSFAVLTASDRLQAADTVDKFWICYDIGTGALAVADSVRALNEAYSHEFRSMAPFLKQVALATDAAGRVFTFVDAMRNLHGGYTLLFESGDVGYELKSGSASRAAAVSAKGMTQIVIGATQAGELLGIGALVGTAGGDAAAAGAASLPVALVIVVGGMLVICGAEVYLEFSGKYGKEINAFERSLHDALEAQGPSPDVDQQSADPSLRVTEQLKAFAQFIEARALR